MSIKRYTATADTTITNAFQANLRTRMTGSNTGKSDILQVFSIYGQANTSSSELSRVLLKFPVTNIVSDRSANKIPVSGSVNFYLRLFNAPHSETVPNDFSLKIQPVSRSWEEGLGLDHEEGTDITRNNTGANWINSASGTLWSSQGGDYLNTLTSSQYFDTGLEDLEVDITPLVESWISGGTSNNGVGVFLTSSNENSVLSYYIKKFFARTSEFFFSRPVIEARWNGATTDDRGRFYVQNNLLSTADNTHSLYLYNYVGGQLKNIANIGSGTIYVQLYTSASGGDLVSTTPTVVTGGFVSTGIYSASFILDTTSSIVYDRWFSGSTYYYTGTLQPLTFSGADSHLTSKTYVNSITNLKSSYKTNEIARLRLFVKDSTAVPNLYTIASRNVQNNVIDKAYYKISRVNDGLTIIPYGTGSVEFTKFSYDTKGNFADIDMSTFEPGFAYEIKVGYILDSNFEEQREKWTFRVD